MTQRLPKHVLVVDDILFTCNDIRAAFLKYNKEPDGAFTFEVDIDTSIHGAIDQVRARGSANQYDVIVLDLSFDQWSNENRDGLRIADALGLYRRLGQAIPVVIVFSGYANSDLRAVVQVMRHGAWDVIDKSEGPDGDPFRRVVSSAVTRLKALELQKKLNTVALEWFQRNIVDLQNRYSGQVVAIWTEPEVQIVATGHDAFELETRLSAWRAGRPSWMYPFVVQIPKIADAEVAQGARP